MAKVTLAKALKTKNRLASRITQVKKQMTTHNAYIVEKTIPVNEIKIQVDVPALKQELNDLTNKLVEVKSAISKGNVGSAPMIFALSEKKGLVSYWESLDCEEGKVTDPYKFRNQLSDGDVKRVQISVAERNQIVQGLVSEIEKLQDQLDEYNATHRVEIPDDVL